MNINKKIATLVALAQVASDAGKNIYDLRLNGDLYYKARNNGYGIKDYFIINAINLIDKNKSDWRYGCQKSLDQRGNMSKVIYFTYNDQNGRFYQISFHSFAGGMIKEKAKKRAGTAMFWDHKNSRLSAYQALRACGGHGFLKKQ